MFLLNIIVLIVLFIIYYLITAVVTSLYLMDIVKFQSLEAEQEKLDYLDSKVTKSVRLFIFLLSITLTIGTYYLFR